VRHGNESLVQQFVRNSKESLKPCLKEYGLVLYSHKSTLRRNPVLFYGYNPGCDPSVSHPIRWTIEQSLDYFEDGFKILEDSEFRGNNPGLINEQRWPTPSFSRDYDKGQAPYQRRTRCLLEAIGCCDALVTNLFFRQTRDAEQLRATLGDDFVEACWRVHEIIFRITEPNVIIACREVVRQMFRREFGLGSSPISEIRAKHAEWKCRHWQGNWEGRPIDVLEIPHFSRYDITKPARKSVLDWAEEIVSTCVETRGTDLPQLASQDTNR
jgi:hypothetical protein